MSIEPFGHFIDAQAPIFDRALDELRAGRKETHWMWFVFPQMAGLGRSEMARRFSLASLSEAQAYAAHPVLDQRLREATGAALSHIGENGAPRYSASTLFGAPDDQKFQASMTLFARAAPNEGIFFKALDGFFDGAEHRRTLELLGIAEGQ